MTLGGFLIGMVLFGLGFLMVWRRRDFRNYLGDLGAFFDLPGSSWLSWEVLGSALMFVGFMVAFGVFQLFAEKLLKSIIFPTIG
jgi:hypothetical protein